MALPELGDVARTGFRASIEPATAASADRRLAIELKDPRGQVRRIGPITCRWQKTNGREPAPRPTLPSSEAAAS